MARLRIERDESAVNRLGFSFSNTLCVGVLRVRVCGMTPAPRLKVFCVVWLVCVVCVRMCVYVRGGVCAHVRVLSAEYLSSPTSHPLPLGWTSLSKRGGTEGG
jgi:hypothetical protein